MIEVKATPYLIFQPNEHIEFSIGDSGLISIHMPTLKKTVILHFFQGCYPKIFRMINDFQEQLKDVKTEEHLDEVVHKLRWKYSLKEFVMQVYANGRRL